MRSKRSWPDRGLRKTARAKFPIVLRGRRFGPLHLKTIRHCTKKFHEYGRTRISIEVCKALGWRQANGWLKDRACRDVLVKLAKQRLLRLPRRRTSGHAANKLRKKKRRF